MSKSLSTIARGICAIALSFAGLAVFANAAGAATLAGPTNLAAGATDTITGSYAGSGTVTFAWTNPSATVGITGYSVVDGASFSTGTVLCSTTGGGIASAANSCTYSGTGLAAGDTVNVYSTDGTAADAVAGDHAYTIAAPAAPTFTATVGNGTVTFVTTINTSDRTAALRDTKAVIYMGSATMCTAAVSAAGTATCVVNDAAAGLDAANGGSYNFTSSVFNAAGSTPSSTGTLARTVGTTPSAFTATATLNSATQLITISWTTPASPGPGSLTYTVTSLTAVKSGTWTCTTVTTNSCTIPVNAANGTPTVFNDYFTVKATNSASLYSVANTNLIAIGGAVPGAPTAAGGTWGIAPAATSTGTATIFWTAASSQATDTGFILQFESCTSASDNTTCSASGSPINVPIGVASVGTTFSNSGNGIYTNTSIKGIAKGGYYSYTVQEVNAYGAGPALQGSIYTYGLTVPGAASISAANTTATAASTTNSGFTANWTAPVDNGGSAVTGYSVGLYKVATGLANGTYGAASVAKNSGGTALTVTYATAAPSTYVGAPVSFTVTGETGCGSASTGFVSSTTSTTIVIGTLSSGCVITSESSPGITALTLPISAGYTTTSAATSTATSFTFSGLGSGDYYTTILAKNATGTASATASIVATADVSVGTWQSGAPAVAYSGTSVRFTSNAAVPYAATYYIVNSATLGTVCTMTISAATGLASCTVAGSSIAALIAAGYTGFKMYSVDAAGTSSTLTSAATVAVPQGTVGTVHLYGNAYGLSVTWVNPTSGATQYNIQLLGSNGSSNTVTAALGDVCVDATAGHACIYYFPASGLAAGVTYSAAVNAANAIGGISYASSTESAVSLVSTTATAATAPTSVTLTATSGTSLSAAWSGQLDGTGNPITSFTAVLTDASGNTITCTTTASPCAFSGLTTGAKYSVVVSANSTLDSPESAAAVSAVVTGVPSAPTLVTATRSTATPTSITLTWNAPSSNGGRALTASGGYVVTAVDALGNVTASPTGCDSIAATTLTCTATGLSATTAYTFTIKAANAIGSSTASNALTVAALAKPSTAPTGLTAVAAGLSKTIVLSWTAPANNGGSAITSYVLTPYDNTNPNNPSALSTTNIYSDGTTQCVSTASGLATGITESVTTGVVTVASGSITSVTCTFYTWSAVSLIWKVTAANAIGNSPASSASAALKPLAKPAAPVPAFVATTGSTNVAWSAVSGATSYTVQQIGGPATVTSTVVAPTHNLVMSTSSGYTYNYYVTANNAFGSSSPALAVAPSAATISNVSLATNVVTITTAAAHGFAVGQTVVVAATTATAVNGTFVIATVPTSTTFTYALTHADISAATDTGTAKIFGAPAAPTAVIFWTNSASYGATMQLSWTASAEANFPVTYTVIGLSTLGATLVNATGLATTTYSTPYVAGETFTVYAVTSAGVSAGAAPGTTYTNGTVPGTITATPSIAISADDAYGATTGVPGGLYLSTFTVAAGTTTTAAGSIKYTLTITNPSGVSKICSGNPAYGTTSDSIADGTQFAIVTAGICGGLTPNTTYTYTLAQANQIGAGPTLSGSFVTPATVPGKPTGVTSVGSVDAAGNLYETVTWTAPANTGGLPITGYVVSFNDQAGSKIYYCGSVLTATSTSCTIYVGTTAITANALTLASVIAQNLAGNSSAATDAANTTDVFGTVTGDAMKAGGAASAPTVSGTTGVLSAGYGSLLVSWSETNTSSNAVTGFSVTATGTDGTTATCTGGATATSCTLTGLSNQAYSVVVKSLSASTANTTGGGSAAGANTQFTGWTAPVTNVIVNSITASTFGTLAVVWTAPVFAAGSSEAPITGYTVTATSSTGVVTTLSAGPTATSATLTGLANGTTYTVAVTPVNAVGNGPTSSISGATLTATVPGAPTGVTATATTTAGALTVTWTAPSSNGGATVTGYTVTAKPTTGSPVSAASTGTTATLTGLSNASSYTITVTATNAVGTSVASTSVIGTTDVAPVAPTGVTVTPAFNTTYGDVFTVSWTAPVSNGGTAITGYTVKATNTTTGAATSCTITGAASALCPALVAGQNFAVTVTANNAAGSSVAGSALAASFGNPKAVTGVTAVRNANGLQISWTPTAGAFGAIASTTEVPVLGYIVTATDQLTGAQFACGVNATYGVVLAPAVTCNIAGLTVGSNYTVSVKAANLLSGLSPAATVTALYNSLTPEPIIATFSKVTAAQKSVSALSPVTKTALSGLISSINDGASITITGYGTTKAIALARANAAANYLFSNGAAVHVTITTVISKTVTTALVTVTSN